MEQKTNDFIENFNFKTDGQIAVVAVLHSNVSSFETIKTHWLKSHGQFKHIKCLGDGCPACAIEPSREELILRIYDFTDGKVKVWSLNNSAKSTQKLVKSLSETCDEWGVPLNKLRFKLTCHKKQAVIEDNPINYFEYDVANVPDSKYPIPEDTEIDVKYAIRTAAKRSADDIKTFMDTGTMPPKPPYDPNKKSSGNENAAKNATTTNNSKDSYSTSTQPTEYESVEDDDLPF